MAKTFIGKVISAKMQKTVVVSCERRLRHPFYHKIITRHKKFKAHYEDMDLHEGDTVEIQESRPISKEIHFIVINKIKT